MGQACSPASEEQVPTAVTTEKALDEEPKEAPDRWAHGREQMEVQLTTLEKVVLGLRGELAQERKLAEIRAFKLRDNQLATDEERNSALEYCKQLNFRLWQWEDWSVRWFAEREKLQDQLRGLEAALRAADEGLRHITEYKSETSAAAYTREQELINQRDKADTQLANVREELAGVMHERDNLRQEVAVLKDQIFRANNNTEEARSANDEEIRQLKAIKDKLVRRIPPPLVFTSVY
jgi:predicted  nucleic acid-binding Zn-ribbon protein